MRDPKRIYDFCVRLAVAWENNCPDMRFGQFIVNAFGELGRDPFFKEDGEMIEFLEKWAKNNSPYHAPEEPKSKEEERKLKSCREVTLCKFPYATFEDHYQDGICTADVYGKHVIHCDDWNSCSACWDQDAPDEYQEDK